jgi:hypothetical protein
MPCGWEAVDVADRWSAQRDRMDDWSTIPNHRNAVSEPAPNHRR